MIMRVCVHVVCRKSEGHMSNRTTPRTRPMLSVSVESSLVAGDTEDIVKQAENILDDDTLLDISLNM